LRSADAVLQVGGMDQRFHDQAQCIDEQMAFAAGELLATS
jgi:hypothetical protein